jgi:hypothetical protein
MVKLTEGEAIPGVVVSTATLAKPHVAMSVLSIWAESCVELVTVVVLGLPFQLTKSPAAKFVPLTVSVNAGPPGAAFWGENGELAEIVGPLSWTGLITKVTAADVPPPGAGFVTVTCAIPTLATSAGGIMTESWVEAVSKFTARWKPFHSAVEVSMNPLPATWRTKGSLPTVIFGGNKPQLETGGVPHPITGVAFKEEVELLPQLPPARVVPTMNASKIPRQRVNVTLPKSSLGFRSYGSQPAIRKAEKETTTQSENPAQNKP